jgi:hypothetical protein
MKRLILLTYFAVLLLMTGCMSTGFLMAKPVVTIFGQTYPEKPVDAVIEVFITSLPDIEYWEIALISVADTNDKWSMQQIQIEARKIGADGVIIVGRTGSLGTGFVSGDLAYTSSEEYGLSAIAIKYK